MRKSMKDLDGQNRVYMHKVINCRREKGLRLNPNLALRLRETSNHNTIHPASGEAKSKEKAKNETLRPQQEIQTIMVA